MSHITLELREAPPRRIDLSGLTPNRLSGQDADKIATLPLYLGRHSLSVGELFQVRGNDASTLIFKNTCDRLDRIGAQMSHGHIIVEGDCGAYAGRSMQDGTLLIHGQAGRYAGAGMRGGRLYVEGSTDDFLGAAPPGESLGIRGGMILVKGDCGDRLGDRQRRGLILVEGDAGNYCGSRMIAGTIGVLGEVGNGTGYGMRRGSILVWREPLGIPVTFNDAGQHDLRFLALLLRDLRNVETRFIEWESENYRARRLVGDLGCDGRGEILVLD